MNIHIYNDANEHEETVKAIAPLTAMNEIRNILGAVRLASSATISMPHAMMATSMGLDKHPSTSCEITDKLMDEISFRDGCSKDLWLASFEVQGARHALNTAQAFLEKAIELLEKKQ